MQELDMDASRATVRTSSLGSPTPVRSLSPHGPPRLAPLAGRFFGLSLHAFKAVMECAQRLAISLGELARSQHPDEFDRALDWIRQDIRRGSKRAYREKSHAAIAEAEQRARRTPPRAPVWTTRAAPWAKHWGMIQPRGRRRMRDWT